MILNTIELGISLKKKVNHLLVLYVKILTRRILYSFINSSSKKQVEVPKFNEIIIWRLFGPMDSGIANE